MVVTGTHQDRPAWYAYAQCVDMDPNMFFPSEGDEVGIAAAKAVCAQCPVQRVCLEHALTVREKEGVWGGATEAERRKILRSWRRGPNRHEPLQLSM